MLHHLRVSDVIQWNQTFVTKRVRNFKEKSNENKEMQAGSVVHRNDRSGNEIDDELLLGRDHRCDLRVGSDT